MGRCYIMVFARHRFRNLVTYGAYAERFKSFGRLNVNNNMETTKYLSWPVPKLKSELRSRGATTKGRKTVLIERLQAYDRNANFENEPVNMPEPLDVHWPTKGFQQIQTSHIEDLPHICLEQIDMYFVHRLAGDRQCSGDIKAVEKGWLLVESNRVLATSILPRNNELYFSGIVGAAMKNKVSYSFKLKLEKDSGDILNSHCECPAGRGPHGTCKHIAAVLIMLQQFTEGKGLHIKKSSTENLQTFHKPKQSYSGSPVKAENLPTKRKQNDHFLEDPRPLKYRNSAGFPDRVRNMVTNFCSVSSQNLAYRYLYPKADIQTATTDHLYLERPFTEYWVDQALQVTETKILQIEEQTRGQSSSRKWFDERSWRLTASRFGEICLSTHRRNKTKLCASLVDMSAATFGSEAPAHGKTYEGRAIKKFEEETHMKVRRCGFFICSDRPYLGASPDGLIGDETIIEVKCPYAGRNEMICPGKKFPYLENDWKSKAVVLKTNCKYFFQIQGQLYITKRKYCFFVVYTFKDIFIQKITLDKEYCEGSMLPKLDLFYLKYFRPYVASKL